jgi:hypothetical protein
MDLSLFLYPRNRSFVYSLSDQYSYFRWSTQGTVSLPTMLKIMGRTITKAPPPLTLEQVLAMQAQMLQTMLQTMVNQNAPSQARAEG